jgi:hypothetical protein
MAVQSKNMRGDEVLEDDALLNNPMQQRRMPSINADRLVQGPGRSPNWLIGLPLLAFGIPLWILAAKTTVDGWVAALNWFVGLFRIAPIIGALNGWLYIGLAAGIGLLYSKIEMHIPFSKANPRPDTFSVFGWVILVISDVASTFFGLYPARADMVDVQTQIAHNLVFALIIAIIGTFLPDWMALIGARKIGLMRRR